MITRLYLKECLSFNEVDLEFNEGLNIFSGPSGAGKSILMEGILSLFSLGDVKSKLGEVTLSSMNINEESFDISSEDDLVIKTIKKENVRFFLNNQTISKKNLNTFSNRLIKHLNLKDTSDFKSSKMLDFLDKLSARKNKKFIKIKEKFDNEYLQLKKIEKELKKIKEDELKIVDLIEYTKYEIEKIEQINPDVDEYEELSFLKRKLTKKDKIEEAIKKAAGILEYNQNVSNALELLEVDSNFFDEAINELSSVFEKFNDSLHELEDIDIENVLDRIEKLSSLKKRFGSIQEALDYKDSKKVELFSYENISFEKSKLENKVLESKEIVSSLATEISVHRKKSSKILEEKINYYLKFLYLSNSKIIIDDKQLDSLGIDDVLFKLNGVALSTISSGEYNRLRLALLTSMSEFDIIDKGILFLDEIDANLSGKESESIAKVLSKLSKSYQIFAISHQPQLTACSNQHFLVDKNNNKSCVRLLDRNGKINEIARMISGENITNEALNFAENLLVK